jgi:glutathione S-transferase
VLDDHLAQRAWAAGATFTLADCAARARAVVHARRPSLGRRRPRQHRARYYRDLMARGSVARVVDEARPWRDVLPLPWPADMDALERWPSGSPLEP